MTHCIKILNRKKDGTKMRPATFAPGMHWTGMLISQYSHANDISVKWIDGEPTAIVGKGLWQTHQHAFKHVMQFIKLHDLDYEITESECANCDGHKDCVSGKCG